MNVLSLFDGMSCGQLALERAGIKVDKYYASEIKKHAIKVTMENYPDTIQLGDVTKIQYKDGILYTENGNFNVGKIDLLIGGSPCQDFSLLKVGGKGLDGDKSKLSSCKNSTSNYKYSSCYIYVPTDRGYFTVCKLRR